MTIARSEDINQDDTSILNLFKKTSSFCKHFGAVLTEEIQIGKFCTEVFVMPKHLMINLNIPESSLYIVSIPCNRFTSTILQNYCDMVKFCSFCSFT